MHNLLARLERLIDQNQSLLTRLFFLLTLVGLYFSTKVNYLLFHALAELFSIVIASCLFTVAWNSRQYIKNQYLLFVGIASLFIAVLDLLHTLAYKGMPIFTDYAYYANQLWIGARYLESVTLTAAFYFLWRDKQVWPFLTFVGFLFITGLIVASIFWWKIFPICFVEGQGLTAFKKNSEYLICCILLIAGVFLVKNRERFEPAILRLLALSILATIISELAFTFYIDNYGFSNLIGHYFKIFSFVFIYQAIVSTGIKSPYILIFRELEKTNTRLTNEISARIEVEKNLKKAVNDVKILSGIIPICSHCKKIRNDEGYWQQVELFINKHVGAMFSHGFCPECCAKEMREMKEVLREEGRKEQ